MIYNVNINELFVGPQLVGAIFIIAGLIQQRYQPQKINSFYGYRTPLSMKNQQNWDEGNRFSSKLIVKIGLGILLFGIAVAVLLKFVTSYKLHAALLLISLLSASMGGVIVLLIKTEKHLERFEKDNL